MKQHKWHKEIKAWADGAEIQFKDANDNNEWLDYTDNEPTWEILDFLEYRIKPQPKTPKQAWDEELTRSYKETIIERLRNDDKFYDEVFSAYDNAKDNEIKPQPKEPQYLYVWNVFSKIVFTQDKNGIVIDTWDPSVLPKYIGKIKLEDSDA